MEWIIWGILLLIQNASFTWVSRARNSANVWYHAVAAIGSNGVWIVSQFVLVNKFVEVMKSGDRRMLIVVCVFYTTLTVIGSVSTHSLLMRFVEKGSRNIGSH